MFLMEIAWTPVDGREAVGRQRSWLKDYYEAMQPHVPDKPYVNSPSRNLTNWAHAYYAGNLERLQNIKWAFDPNSVFRFEQSIEPKKPG